MRLLYLVTEIKANQINVLKMSKYMHIVEIITFY